MASPPGPRTQPQSCKTSYPLRPAHAFRHVRPTSPYKVEEGRGSSFLPAHPGESRDPCGRLAPRPHSPRKPDVWIPASAGMSGVG